MVGIIFFLAQFAYGLGDRQIPQLTADEPVIPTATTAWKPSGPAPPRSSSWAWCSWEPRFGRTSTSTKHRQNAIPIEIMAKQFAFNFRYPGADGRSARRIRLINDANGDPFGLDPKDPAGKDDINSASLKVPLGKPIKLIMHSRDVIHNFFVPELRMKQDIVPGMEIPLHFQADKIGICEVPCSRTVRARPFPDTHHHAGDEQRNRLSNNGK